jgi:hypothetical protein
MEGCFTFFILIVVAITVLSNVTKNPGNQGQKTGNFLQNIENILQTSTQTSTAGSTGVSPAPTVAGSPVNWHIIKMNMSREQMAECFDLAAFKSGVKKKDFPKYVYLDKLRKYFTDAQLQDMIDLDLFLKYEEENKRVASTQESRLQGLTCKTESGALQAAKRERQVFSPKVSEPAVMEPPVREVVFESVDSKTSKGDSLVEHLRSEEEISRLAERYNLKPHESLFLERMSKRFTTAENKELAMVLRDVADNCSSGDAANDPVSGIIWSEILKRPDPADRMRRIFPQFNNQNVDFQKY